MLERLSIYILGGLMLGIIYTVFFYDFMIEFGESKPENTPDFMFKDVVISHFDNGILELEVSSNRAYIYKESQEIILDNSQGVSYLDESRFMRFNSSKGRYDLSNQKLYLDSAYMVYVQKDDFLWIYAKSLFWDPVKQQVFSDKLSTIQTDVFYISTQYLLYDVGLNRIYLHNYPNLSITMQDDYEKNIN